MAPPEQFRRTSLTLPMIAVGTLLGTVVCVANMYFGLQLGTLDTMSMSTALLSFAIFKWMDKWLNQLFTPTENIVVQALASSIAGMPLAASFTSVIPAFEFLRTPREGGSLVFSFYRLVVWSLGVSLFGTVFAAPFRNYFLIRERLRFPANFAVAVLIGVLHKDPEVARRADLDQQKRSLVGQDVSTDAFPDQQVDPPVTDQRYERDGEEESRPAELAEDDAQASSTIDAAGDEVEWSSNVRIMAKSFSVTVFYIVLSYIFPVVAEIPIFGYAAARDWLWFLSLSPAFLSFGMILDPPVAVSMLLGAVLGWGILSPLAKGRTWAPGPIDDMESGVRGWLLWVSIGLLLGDAVVRALGSAINVCLAFYRESQPDMRPRPTVNNSHGNPDVQPLLEPLPEDEVAEETPASTQQYREANFISNRMFASLFSFSVAICILSTFIVFGYDVPIYLTVAAIVVALPLCIVVLQASGETSTVPSQSLSNACQFAFGLVVTKSTGTSLATMVAGGITEACLWQSAVLMGDLKTAYIVQAHPGVMLQSQILGSIIGCFVGSGIYRLFIIVYKIPSTSFPIPLAHMWARTARLVQGGDFPDGVGPFLAGAFVLSAILRFCSSAFARRKWATWIPSGVAMSIGMYVPPSVTMAKFIGAGLQLYLSRRWGVSKIALMSAATGCILSEGLLGFLPTVLESLGAPQARHRG